MPYIQDLATSKAKNGAPSAAETMTLSATPAATSTILIEIVVNGTATVNSITDARTNTWTSVHAAAATTTTVTRLYQFYTNQNVAQLISGDLVTMNTTPGTGTTIIANIRELLGPLTLDSVSNTTSNNTAGTSMTISTTGAINRPVELVWVSFGVGISETTWTKDANFSVPTANVTNQATATRTLLSEYRDIVSSGTQTGTGTTTSAVYAGMISTWYRPSFLSASGVG